MPSKVVMFDLDDLLLMNVHWYWARWEMFKYVMCRLGFEKYEDELIPTLNKYDIARVESHGFQPDDFGCAMGETYEHYCELEGFTPDPSTKQAIEHIGHSVFDHKPILFPGAREILEYLKGKGYHLYCVTKGDEPHQTAKLRDAGLAEFFEDVRIVFHDKKDEMEDLLRRHPEVPRTDVYFVGNSLRSDMAPAVALGINAVWIPHDTWDYEDETPEDVRENVVTLDNILGLKNIL